MSDENYDVSGPWESSNQDWWDWYVTLAYNDTSLEKRFSYELPHVLSEPLSSESLEGNLHDEYLITEREITNFRLNGYIKLKNVFSEFNIALLRSNILKELIECFGKKKDWKQKFLSLDLVWEKNRTIREFVINKRLAGIAAKLLGVKSVRLYHDNILSKEPGCGRTPWHYDTHHFPIATNNVVTAWIPAQSIPFEMGPLIFATPIDSYKLVECLRFSKNDTTYDRNVSEIFNKHHEIEIDDSPYQVGEVSFHHNLSFHCAPPNLTNESRLVLANTYFEDGATVVDKPTMVSGDWQKFIPGTKPGEKIRTERNPICWGK